MDTGDGTTIGRTNDTSDGTNTSVVVLSVCSSGVSILGSFVILWTYIFIPEIRNSTRKLVTCLNIADFLTALGYLISGFAHFVGTQDDICFPQSVITTYSSLVSFYLMAAIAIHIFTTVVYRRDITSTWKFLLLANIVSWIVPGIIVSVASADGVLGRDTAESVGTGPWCWLKSQHSNYTVWMFLTGKGWEFCCYLLTTSLYVLLKFHLYLRHRHRSFSAIHESLREDDQNYLYVWFVLYLLRLWGSIRSMMSLTGVDGYGPGDRISEVFMYMQAVGDPGQAFCNCVLFCFLDSTVRSHLFRTCFPGTQNKENALHDERSRLLPNGNHHGYNEELPHALGDDVVSGSSCQYSNVGTHGTIFENERKGDTSNEGSRNVQYNRKTRKTVTEECA